MHSFCHLHLLSQSVNCTRSHATKRPNSQYEGRKVMRDCGDFSLLDDSALLNWRAEARAELERLPSASVAHATLTALYDQSTSEVNERARRAWSRAN
jgi:hypothetical protein